MELAAVEALYDEIHEELPFHDGSFRRWAAERSRAFPYHYRDGVTLTVDRDEDTSEDIFEEPARYAGEDIDDEGR